MTSAVLGAPLLTLAVAVARLAAAFALTPFLAPSLVPGLVRICILVSLAAWLMATGQLSAAAAATAPPMLAITIAREMAIGLVLGFTFSGLLWAFQMAGETIDSKIGGSAAVLLDPLSGDRSAVHATLLLRFAGVLFAAGGGLSIFCHLIFESYRLWPLGGSGPNLSALGLGSLTGGFGEMMSRTLVVAAPALVLLTLAEAAMGFVNRAAPKLNAFSISLALKSWLAGLIVLLMTGRLAADILARLHGVDGAATAALIGSLR